MAGLYLSAPYLIMLYVGLREGRKKPRIGLTEDEDITKFMRLKDREFESAGGNRYEARVTTDDELVGYVERGWEIVMDSATAGM